MATPLRCAWMCVLVFMCVSFCNARRDRVLLGNGGQGTGIGYGNRAINKATNIGVDIQDYPPTQPNIGGDLVRRVPQLNPNGGDDGIERMVTPYQRPHKSGNVDEPMPPDTSADATDNVSSPPPDDTDLYPPPILPAY